jgi:hypothetical protein
LQNRGPTASHCAASSKNLAAEIEEGPQRCGPFFVVMLIEIAVKHEDPPL